MNSLSRQTIRRLVPWFKAIVGIAVAIGLFFATRSAILQWNEQASLVQQQLDRIDEDWLAATDPGSRETLVARRETVARSVPTLGNLDWQRIVVAMLLYAAALLPPALVLRSALSTMGQSPPLSVCIASQLLGHAGKYVPGKAMVVVLRAGGLATAGVGPLKASIGVFMETLLMMAVGAALSGLIMIWLPVPVWMEGAAALIAIAATIPVVPHVLVRIVGKVVRTDAGEPTEPLVSHRQCVRFFVQGWLWSFVSWLLIGVSFSLLVSAIPSTEALPSPATLLGIATASIGLAMVIGFASLLPGGAGIRELILTTLLATSVGTAHALLAAIAGRLMFITVESVAAAMAWLWLRRKRGPPGPVSDRSVAIE